MATIRPYGPTAWLVDDLPDAAAWAAGLDEADLPGVEEIVPTEGSVLVVVARERCAAVGAALPAVLPRERSGAAETVEIDVRYDGPDLDDVARACGATVDDVVALHSGADYVVAFCGFSPGFAYLRGLPTELHLPRRSRPRVRVRAGAVAMAAAYSAVYPSPSPGGWHLIGHTDLTVWDADRHPPTRLRPGTHVRFRAR